MVTLCQHTSLTRVLAFAIGTLISSPTIAMADSYVTDVARRLVGTMDSSNQAVEDPRFFDVTLLHCAVGVRGGRSDARYLLLEQAVSVSQERPYRVRFLEISEPGDGDDDAQETDVQIVSYQPIDGSRWIGLCDRAPRQRQLDVAALGAPRCTVRLEKQDDVYAGGALPGECQSGLRGAAYVTSEVRLGRDWMESWDRGFDSEGRQVWGSRSGPYRFERVNADEQAPRVVEVAAAISGRSDNWAQTQGQPRDFVPASYSICPIKTTASALPPGSRVSFVSQELMLPGSTEPFVRERVYAFFPSGQRIGFTSWDFLPGATPNVTCENSAVERERFEGRHVDWASGCSMEFEPAGRGIYRGRTLEGGCPSTYRGATRLEIESELRDGVFNVWERWYDADDQQVAGATEGPYAYRRIPPCSKGDVPPLFQDHVGMWQGTVHQVDREGRLERAFEGTFDVRLRGCQYWQQNSYDLRSGSTLVLQFNGRFRAGRLTLTTPNYDDFEGEAWTSNDVLFFRSQRGSGDAARRIVETITLQGPTQRVRSSQVFNGEGDFEGVVFINEERRSRSLPAP